MAGETIARFVSEFMKSKKGSAVCVQRDTEAALIYSVDATKRASCFGRRSGRTPDHAEISTGNMDDGSG